MPTLSLESEIETEWLHIQYEEKAGFIETYGFSGNQGAVNLVGLLLRPSGVASTTLLIYMHSASTLQLLPVPRANVRRGAHVVCAASRHARNDTALILEKVLLDLKAYVRHAKTVLGCRNVGLVR